MRLWSAIKTVYATNVPIDERQLALAKEQMYETHVALLGVLGADDPRRRASEEFVGGVRAEREAEKRAYVQLSTDVTLSQATIKQIIIAQVATTTRQVAPNRAREEARHYL